jgi:hypothetical protein
MDNLITFQQPKELTEMEMFSLLGQIAAGAPGGMAADTIANAYAIGSGDKNWPQWLATMPLPGVVKDIFKAYDLYENGPKTATGVSTGKPPGVLPAVMQGLGMRTRAQARPFEQGSAAKKRMQDRADEQKAAITRAVLNQGYTSGNMAKVRAYNKANPDSRITMKSLAQARKRRRRTEREIARENVE